MRDRLSFIQAIRLALNTLKPGAGVNKFSAQCLPMLMPDQLKIEN